MCRRPLGAACTALAALAPGLSGPGTALAPAGLAIATPAGIALLAAPARAYEDPVALAGRAAEQVSAAAAELAAARSAPNRLAALGRVVQAYETGLAAMRDGMRTLSGRMAALEARLDVQRADLEQILGLLQVIEHVPAPLQMLHPSGPLGAVRAGHMMAEISPALEAELIDLQMILAEMNAVRLSQDRARAVLRTGLVQVQEARIELAEALRNRAPAPAGNRRLLDDLGTHALSLREFADGLAALPRDRTMGGQVVETTFSAARGDLPLPVAGRVLRGFGERDAAGIARPGLVLEAPAQAIVTAPWQATVRYAGEFLDYGEIVILEPQPGYLLVLAGLGHIDRAPGEVLEPGEPIGTLGGLQPAAEEFLIDGTDGNRAIRPETLYMELRQDGEPVDPTPWFVLAPEQEGSP